MKYKGVLKVTLEQHILVEAEDLEEAVNKIETKIEGTNYKVLSGPYFQFLEVLCHTIHEEDVDAD